jgi:hypothetical protein
MCLVLAACTALRIAIHTTNTNYYICALVILYTCLYVCICVYMWVVFVLAAPTTLLIAVYSIKDKAGDD